MYDEIDNSEHTYIEVFGDDLVDRLSNMFSYYSNTDLPNLKTTIRPELTPDRTFTVPNTPGATHRYLVDVTKEHPDGYVRTRTMFNDYEAITEYRAGHFKGYSL